jgi:hypothetical protein
MSKITPRESGRERVRSTTSTWSLVTRQLGEPLWEGKRMMVGFVRLVRPPAYIRKAAPGGYRKVHWRVANERVLP